MYGPVTKPLNLPSDLIKESKFQHYPIFVACGHVWVRYNLEMCLKNKLREVPRGLLSSPKGLVFFKGGEIVLQPFSDSQDLFEAREKSILNDFYPISGPNVSFM
jgi:hypothetical protein